MSDKAHEAELQRHAPPTGRQDLYCKGCGKNHGRNVHAACAARCCPDKNLVTSTKYIEWAERRMDAMGDVVIAAMKWRDAPRKGVSFTAPRGLDMAGLNNDLIGAVDAWKGRDHDR